MTDDLYDHIKCQPRRVTAVLRRLTVRLEAIAIRPEGSFNGVEAEALRLQQELRLALNDFYEEMEACGGPRYTRPSSRPPGRPGNARGVRPNPGAVDGAHVAPG